MEEPTALLLLSELYDSRWEELPVLARLQMLEECRTRGVKQYRIAIEALGRVMTKEGESVAPEAMHHIVIAALDRINESAGGSGRGSRSASPRSARTPPPTMRTLAPSLPRVSPSLARMSPPLARSSGQRSSPQQAALEVGGGAIDAATLAWLRESAGGGGGAPALALSPTPRGSPRVDNETISWLMSPRNAQRSAVAGRRPPPTLQPRWPDTG